MTIDVGNTNITLGVFDGEELRATFRLTTKACLLYTSMNLSAFLKERYPDYRKKDNPCAALLDEDYLKYQRVLQANKIMAESDLGQYLDQVLADSGYTLYLINDGSALTDQLAQALERAGIGQEDCTRLCARLNASSDVYKRQQGGTAAALDLCADVLQADQPDQQGGDHGWRAGFQADDPADDGCSPLDGGV